MGLWYPLCPLVTTSSNGITHHYQWYPHKIDGFLPRPYRYVLNPHESPVTSINWSSIMDHSHHSPFPITCVPLLHWLNPHSWIIHIPVRTKNLFPCWFSTPAFWGTKPPKKIHPSPVCDTTVFDWLLKKTSEKMGEQRWVTLKKWDVHPFIKDCTVNRFIVHNRGISWRI